MTLVIAGSMQGARFERPGDTKSKASMKAFDTFNAPYGRGTVAYGTAGERQRWAMKRDHSSPRCTAEWDEFLQVM